MRFPLRSTLCAAALVIGGASALAQPAAPPTAPPPGPSAIRPPAQPAGDLAASIQTIAGQLQQWLVNPNGEVDGLLLADGTQVAFPPHLSARAQAMFKPGDTVRVSGWRAANAPVLRAASLATTAGQRVNDQPPTAGNQPPAPRDPSALTAISASGKVSRLLYSGRGDVNGVLLDGGSIVRFAPHVGAAMAARLQPGSVVYARGWGSRAAPGTAFEATAIGTSADSMQELFAGPGMVPLPPGPPNAPGARGPGGPGGPRADRAARGPAGARDAALGAAQPPRPTDEVRPAAPQPDKAVPAAPV